MVRIVQLQERGIIHLFLQVVSGQSDMHGRHILSSHRGKSLPVCTCSFLCFRCNLRILQSSSADTRGINLHVIGFVSGVAIARSDPVPRTYMLNLALV